VTHPLFRKLGYGAERISRIVDAALAQGAPLSAIRWKPRSVAAVRLVGGLAARGLRFSTVIDVGANVGQFSRAALGFWPDAEILAFEALPACAERLRLVVAPVGRIEVHAVAVGREDGTVTFHPHDYSLSSSALPVTGAASREYGWARQQPSIKVPLRRLDTVLAGRAIARSALLKLDVQGFELEVLAGAPVTLQSVDAILVEVAFDRAYEGQPLFPEVDGWLRSAGWALSGPIDARREGGTIVELDCLYERPAG